MPVRKQCSVQCWASAILLFGLALPASAFQSMGGGGRGADFGGGGRAGDKSGDSGSSKSTLVRFMPPKEGSDDTHGTLMVKTDDGKSLRLEIRTKDNLKIQMGSHDVPAEDYEKFLLPGLAVDIQWNTDKLGARKTQYLTTITFETLQIEGRIVGIDDDGTIVKVFAKPAADRKWPELKKPPIKKPKPPPKSGGGGTLGGGGGTGSSKPKKPPAPPKEKPVQAKQLQLQFFEGISNLTDSAKQSLSVADLRDYKDQQISGTIVFGTTKCVLIDAAIEGEKQEEKTSDAAGHGR